MSFSFTSDWIRPKGGCTPDSYFDAVCDFSLPENAPCFLRIACDSNYAAYLNGSLAAFGQYADYPSRKIFDTVDVTPFVKPGANRLCVVVWYYGVESSCYTVGEAGLIFELSSNDRLLGGSFAETPVRRDPGYAEGKRDMISGQLGLTFRRDEAHADDEYLAEPAGTPLPAGFACGEIVPLPKTLDPRPNKKLILRGRLPSKLIRTGLFRYPENAAEKRVQDNMQYAYVAYRRSDALAHLPANSFFPCEARFETDEDTDGLFFLVDLGAETAGFPVLDIEVDSPCTVDVGWGEHLDDGVCRTAIRGFFFELFLPKGRTVYMNPFRRFGCRYLQFFVHAKKAVVRYAGLRPTDYPLTIRKRQTGNLLRDTIYEVCENTLLRCMHEHYEDCPWREQSNYTLDSRNQMLCGYYAFGETEMPRSALRLIGDSMRDFGLLSITAPTMTDLCIPSFSTMYFIQMDEYIRYSHDVTLADELYPLLERLMATFTDRRCADGLVPSFSGSKRYWNFYEWAPTLSGSLGRGVGGFVEAPLNAMLSLAVSAFASICRALGKNDRAKELDDLCISLNKAIARRFYDPERKLFATRTDASLPFSVLTNSLCLLCGAADGLDQTEILPILACNGTDDAGEPLEGVVPNTLSMNSFRFDALLRADFEKYRPVILDEIDRDYLKMLRAGATSFWETIKGEEDFSEAGSLCHGWSALPIYYYEILNA